MIIIAIIFAVFFIFTLITRKYRNPWKLYLVFGKKGSGKSTYLVKLAYKYQKKGYNVYTNMFDMMIPGVRWFDIECLGDFVPEANSLLLIDEVGMIWDNRNFKNFKPSVRDFFKLQRHYKVLVYLASQTFDIDKKIRDLTDGMILNINVANVLTIGKTIRRSITLTESTSEAESRIAENLKFNPPWKWKYTLIPKWAKCFDSYQTPNLPKLEYKILIEETETRQERKGPGKLHKRLSRQSFPRRPARGGEAEPKDNERRDYHHDEDPRDRDDDRVQNASD